MVTGGYPCSVTIACGDWVSEFLRLLGVILSASQVGTLVLGAFAAFERDLLRERVIAGVRRAQAAGKHCGRPRVEMDLRPALALLREGRSLKEAARILQVSRNTLRRRLRESGEWPFNSTDCARPGQSTIDQPSI